jgi:hypothetical protein
MRAVPESPARSSVAMVFQSIKVSGIGFKSMRLPLSVKTGEGGVSVRVSSICPFQPSLMAKRIESGTRSKAAEIGAIHNQIDSIGNSPIALESSPTRLGFSPRAFPGWTSRARVPSPALEPVTGRRAAYRQGVAGSAESSFPVARIRAPRCARIVRWNPAWWWLRDRVHRGRSLYGGRPGRRGLFLGPPFGIRIVRSDARADPAL